MSVVISCNRNAADCQLLVSCERLLFASGSLVVYRRRRISARTLSTTQTLSHLLGYVAQLSTGAREKCCTAGAVREPLQFLLKMPVTSGHSNHVNRYASFVVF